MTAVTGLYYALVFFPKLGQLSPQFGVISLVNYTQKLKKL